MEKKCRNLNTIRKELDLLLHSLPTSLSEPDSSMDVKSRNHFTDKTKWTSKPREDKQKNRHEN